MKKLLLIVLLITSLSNAQQTERDFKFLLSLGVDPRMATVGPHDGQENNKPTLDIEGSIGFEWENNRIMMQYKSHKAINFAKWTYIQYDLKTNLFKNVYGYGGLEVSQIIKKHPDALYDQPDNYRDTTINPIIFGANLEVQWKFNDDKFGIGSQFSMYQAEDELKEYKKFRKEVTITLFMYF